MNDPYSRIYWTVVDDPKFATIYDDDHHFATWVRLLMIADQAHPASAHVPQSARPSSVAALARVRLIDLTGARYRIHGLDPERARRSDRGRHAADARWNAPRNADASDDAVQTHVQPDARRDETRRDEHRQDESSIAREADEPDDALATYWSLMGTYPNGRTKDWVTELANEFGDRRVSAVMGTEAGGDRKGFLGRVRDRLRSDADKAEKARATASQERLEAEAAAKRITPKQRAENLRRTNEELRKMMPAGWKPIALDIAR